MITKSEIFQALAALDAEVARAKVRVAEVEATLRQEAKQLADAEAARRGADAFVSLLRQPVRDNPGAPPGSASALTGVPRGVNTGLSDILQRVFRESAGAVLTVDEVMVMPEINELTTDRTQVRNGLHYLARRRDVLESVGRGAWRLKNTPSGPVEEEGERTSLVDGNGA